LVTTDTLIPIQNSFVYPSLSPFIIIVVGSNILKEKKKKRKERSPVMDEYLNRSEQPMKIDYHALQQ
jgi:hypothetical protein